jgi:hypothetical protein
MVKKAQLQIQQMTFMILAVFLFFILVGLFFLSYQYKVLRAKADTLNREQAISSLSTITNMPELTCGYLCLDIDKIQIMSNKDYSEIWPVESIKIYRLNQNETSPSYQIYDSGQKQVTEVSTYVSLCKKSRKLQYNYDECEIGKLIVGARIS